MNVQTIKNVGINAIGVAQKSAKKVGTIVKKAVENPVARENFKKSMPIALAATGAFSLMSILPNRKADGKQGSIEKKSGAVAAAVFAIASFKKFFNVENQSFKDIFKKLSEMNIGEAFEILKTNKSNAILFLASIIGVKIVTNVLTKGLDAFINEAANTKNLGE